MAEVSSVVWDSSTDQFLITLDSPSTASDAFDYNLEILPDPSTLVTEDRAYSVRAGYVNVVPSYIFDTGTIVTAVSSFDGELVRKLILPNGTTTFRTNRDFASFLSIEQPSRRINLTVGSLDAQDNLQNTVTGTVLLRLLAGSASNVLSVTGDSISQTFTVNLSSASSDYTYYNYEITDAAGSNYVDYYNPRSSNPAILGGSGGIATVAPGDTQIVFQVYAPNILNNTITFDFEGTTATIVGAATTVEATPPSADPPPGSAPLTTDAVNNAIAYNYSSHLDRIVTALEQISISQASIATSQSQIADKISRMDTNINSLTIAGDPRNVGDGIRTAQPYNEVYLAYLWKEILQGGIIDGYTDSVTDEDVTALLEKINNHDNDKLIDRQIQLMNTWINAIQQRFNAY